ncbi:MAG: hypothetical protein J7M26_07900 [Armatimonadetes bacterium]|nr:hypothetical protein [Armatimonadota bacterium]
MPRWALVLTFVILAVGLTAGYLGLRPRMSDRDLIYHMLADMEQRANQGDYFSLMRYVDDDYRDGSGYSKDDLKRLALQAGRSGEQVQVHVEVKGLVLVKNTATLRVELDVIRSEGEGRPRENYTITARLHKRGRRWLVARADGWQEAAFGEEGGE